MEQHVDGFLLDSPAFVGAFTKRAERVFDTVDTNESIEHITEWVALYANYLAKISLIRDLPMALSFLSFDEIYGVKQNHSRQIPIFWPKEIWPLYMPMLYVLQLHSLIYSS